LKKIPTMFDRDWSGDRSKVVDVPHKDCAWVFAGEGWPTRKIDGTSCLVDGGQLYKRRELKKGGTEPTGFSRADYDEETGKTVGWMPVTDEPRDKYHREAFKPGLPNGTYELVGPKIQGGIEGYPESTLVPHDSGALHLDANEVPRTFSGLRDWLAGKNIEGIVWHHADGRMAKIKLRDFGHKRTGLGAKHG
jgi:hypothetical protein